tara:strand:- start:345 stop:527 length:183 start_codon:yes stop_codon:yes gene_type:complete
MKQVKLDQQVLVQAIRLLGKLIKFSRGGFDKAERQELAYDLLSLGAALLGDIVGQIDAKN